MYGLDKEYVDFLTLPKPSKVKIYDIDKIVNSRKKLSTGEKIDHLLDLKATLLKRLEILKSGRKLEGYRIVTYKEWKENQLKLKRDGVGIITKKIAKEEEKERMSSNLPEPGESEPPQYVTESERPKIESKEIVKSERASSKRESKRDSSKQ